MGLGTDIQTPDRHTPEKQTPDDQIRISTHVDGNPSLDVLYAPLCASDPVKNRHVYRGNVCKNTHERNCSKTSLYESNEQLVENVLENMNTESQVKNGFYESRSNSVFSESHLPPATLNGLQRIPEQQTSSHHVSRIDDAASKEKAAINLFLSESLNNANNSSAAVGNKKSDNVEISSNNVEISSNNVETSSDDAETTTSGPITKDNRAAAAGGGDTTSTSRESLSIPALEVALCGECGTPGCVCRYFTATQLAALHGLDGWDRAYVLMCASRCTSQLILVLP